MKKYLSFFLCEFRFKKTFNLAKSSSPVTPVVGTVVSALVTNVGVDEKAAAGAPGTIEGDEITVVPVTMVGAEIAGEPVTTVGAEIAGVPVTTVGAEIEGEPVTTVGDEIAGEPVTTVGDDMTGAAVVVVVKPNDLAVVCSDVSIAFSARWQLLQTEWSSGDSEMVNRCLDYTRF